MAIYEGLVTDIQSEGRVQVTIRPSKMGIPGAPEVSRRVCHSSTNGSIVRVDVLNEVGAAMGDWVSVRQTDGVVRKNVAVLIGIPLSGGILGMVAALSVTLATAVFYPVLWLLFAGLGLLGGILAGQRIYSRSARHNQLVVQQILRPAKDLRAQFGDVRTRMEKAATSCGDCTQCLTGSTGGHRTGNRKNGDSDPV